MSFCAVAKTTELVVLDLVIATIMLIMINVHGCGSYAMVRFKSITRDSPIKEENGDVPSHAKLRFPF